MGGQHRWFDPFPTIFANASWLRFRPARVVGLWRSGLALRFLPWSSGRSAKRATGSVAPAKMGGYRKRTLEPHRAFIVGRIAQTPHLTLRGLNDELAARGVKVSHNAVWMFLRREGLRFKKNAVRA